MRFKHIAIVGVGLIGGSFALAARRAGLAERITGSDSSDVLERACARGVIDSVEDSFGARNVSEADLVYLAAPVGAIIEFLRTRGSLLKAGAIVTDAGSTKREICRAAREALPSHVTFVGGHPMAGSHNAGVEFADAELFRGAPYGLVLGDLKEESPAARMVESMVLDIGARPVKLTAEEHDRVVARLSHVPQLLTTALACGVNEADLGLAGGGFTEMARLAGSRWSVWEDICRSNADEITLALDEVICGLEETRSSIASGDFAAVGIAFEKANEVIRSLRARTDRGDSR
ncbi:MAG TPA: prephenate dehydrogenase/arogenate dehydrogenase family protein [Blastocatellia bacterium]|nr:prephenate dehydrogenase/arogenate dehydrogenase family protein [Blastocatellia bacterium]